MSKKSVVNLNYGRDEMNLSEFPFAKLNTRDQREFMEYEGRIVVDNQSLVQKWIVRGAGGLGLPSEFGERILMALIAISASNNFDTKTVTFSINQLITLMGVSRNKRYYELIEDQLDRLVGLTIQSQNAFWDHAQEERITTRKAFHVIESLWLRHRDGPNGTDVDGNAYIVWSNEMYKSFQAGYIKKLNLQYFYDLPSPLARRLYRFLDKRMAYKNTYEIDIFDLANRLGCVRSEKPSRVIKIVSSAYQSLIASGFLEDAGVRRHGKYQRFYFVKPSGRDLDIDEPSPLVEAPVAAGDPLWESVMTGLKLQTVQATYDRWLRDLTFNRREGDTIVIGVSDNNALSWIEGRLSGVIGERITDVYGDNVDVRFEVGDNNG